MKRLPFASIASISFLVVAITFLFSANANAQNFWTGAAGDSDFFNAVNWDTGTVPDPSNSNLGFFWLNSEYDVEINNEATIDAMDFRNGTVTLVGNQINLNIRAQVFKEATVRLTAPGTVLVTANINLGEDQLGGSSGTLEFSNGAEAVVSGSVNVSYDSTLQILDATLACDRLAVGFQLNPLGTIDIGSGSTVMCNDGDIGQINAANSVAFVSGIGTIWQVNEALDVGANGTGSLVISNGATVSTFEAVVGLLGSSSGEVTVTGPASQWFAEATTIGDSGDGVLNIENGASASSALDCVLGQNSGATGIVSISGSNSQYQIDGNLVIGLNGVGQFELSDGTILVGLETSINPMSTLTVRSATFESDSLVNAGTMSFPNGFANLDTDVEITPSGLVEALSFSPVNFLEQLNHNGEIFIVPSGRVNVFGEFSGTGEFTGTGALHFKAAVRPGNNNRATIDVQPNTVLESTATVDCEIGGLATTQFDRMLFENDLDIQSAELNLQVVNGFPVSVGDQFTIINVAGNRTGQFAGLAEGAIVTTSNCTDLTISYVGGDGNDIVITAHGDLLGDVNLDGVVNLLDVAPFVNAVSTGTFHAQADINKDGTVNLLDVAPFISILNQ